MRLKLAAAVVLALGAGGCYIVATPHGLAVGVALAPVYEAIPGTEIRVVANAQGDVFHYGGLYYRWYDGRWWRSPAWNTGWVVVGDVPPAFLRIPAAHPRYHVVAHHPHHPVLPAHPVHPAVPVVKEKVEHARPVPAPPPRAEPARPAAPPRAEPARPATPPKVERPARPPKEKEKEEKEKSKKGGK